MMIPYFEYLICILILFGQFLCVEATSSSDIDNCTVEHDGQLLKEGQHMEIKGKLYKVESCALHRAYHACGAYLLQMVSIACEIIKNQRPVFSSVTRGRRYARRKLLTEACCETICTVAEMTRYCPSH